MNDINIADKIKYLREQKDMKQSDLAKRLGITRAGVNSWEMGLTVPSTKYIVELAKLFKVSTDYLLDVKSTASISLDGLRNDDIELLYNIISHLKEKNGNVD